MREVVGGGEPRTRSAQATGPEVEESDRSREGLELFRTLGYTGDE